MTEFIAEKGGRLLSIEDIENLQELALSWAELFKPFGNFVISGCVPTFDPETGTMSVTSGFMFIDGKICAYGGGNISYGYTTFFVAENVYVTSEYEDGTILKSRKIVRAKNTPACPTGTSNINYHVASEDGSYVSYPTFKSQVIDNDLIVKGEGDIIKLQGVVNAIGGICIENKAKLSATDNVLEIVSGSDLSDYRTLNMAIIIDNDSSSVSITDSYPTEKVSETAKFNCGSLSCAEIVPLNATAKHTVSIDEQTYTRSGSPLNIAANKLLVNAQEVALISNIPTNTTKDYEFGEADEEVSDYCKMTVSKIGKNVNISGYIRFGTYEPSSGEVVRMRIASNDVGFIYDADNAFQPTMNVYLPAFISGFGSNSNLQCYVQVGTNGIMRYCIMKSDGEQGDVINVSGKVLNFSGSYVSKK